MSIQRKSPLKLVGGLALAGLGTPDFWPVAEIAVEAARVPGTIHVGIAAILADVFTPNFESTVAEALKLTPVENDAPAVDPDPNQRAEPCEPQFPNRAASSDSGSSDGGVYELSDDPSTGDAEQGADRFAQAHVVAEQDPFGQDQSHGGHASAYNCDANGWTNTGYFGPNQIYGQWPGYDQYFDPAGMNCGYALPDTLWQGCSQPSVMGGGDFLYNPLPEPTFVLLAVNGFPAKQIPVGQGNTLVHIDLPDKDKPLTYYKNKPALDKLNSVFRNVGHKILHLLVNEGKEWEKLNEVSIRYQYFYSFVDLFIDGEFIDAKPLLYVPSEIVEFLTAVSGMVRCDDYGLGQCAISMSGKDDLKALEPILAITAPLKVPVKVKNRNVDVEVRRTTVPVSHYLLLPKAKNLRRAHPSANKNGSRFSAKWGENALDPRTEDKNACCRLVNLFRKVGDKVSDASRAHCKLNVADKLAGEDLCRRLNEFNVAYKDRIESFDFNSGRMLPVVDVPVEIIQFLKLILRHELGACTPAFFRSALAHGKGENLGCIAIGRWLQIDIGDHGNHIGGERCFKEDLDLLERKFD